MLAVDAVIGLLAAGAASAALVGPQLGRIGGGVSGAVPLAHVVLDVALGFSLLMAVSATGIHERAWTALVAGPGLYLAVDVEYTAGAALGRADAGRARATLQRLHEMGVCVALDDYGTGRSSVGCCGSCRSTSSAATTRRGSCWPRRCRRTR